MKRIYDFEWPPGLHKMIRHNIAAEADCMVIAGYEKEDFQGVLWFSSTNSSLDQEIAYYKTDLDTIQKYANHAAKVCDNQLIKLLPTSRLPDMTEHYVKALDQFIALIKEDHETWTIPGFALQIEGQQGWNIASDLEVLNPSSWYNLLKKESK